MKYLLAILCLNLGFCASIRNQMEIQLALEDWRAGREEYKREFAKEIAEVPELANLP